MQIIRSKRINDLLLHPALLALPVAVMIILLLPDAFDKYTITPISEKLIAERCNMEYHDLNHDGISERLVANDNGLKGAGVAIYYGDVPYCQWDFDGYYFNGDFKCLVTDADTNGIDEIYAFTYKGDSLLLNAFDYRFKQNFTIQNKVLLQLPASPKDTVSMIDDRGFATFGCADLTGDGCDELIFQFSAGYMLSPRKIFAYDVQHDSLFASPELGGHFWITQLKDIDDDGKAEFAVTNYGPGNMTDTSGPMPDNAAYVIALDHNLQFLFKPIANKGTYCSARNEFIRINGRFCVLSIWGFNADLLKAPELKLYSLNGTLQQSLQLGDQYKGINFSVMQVPPEADNPSIVLLPSTYQAFALNCNLEPVQLSFPDGTLTLPMPDPTFDFDGDGEKEILLETGTPGNFIVYRNNLSHPVSFLINNRTNDFVLIYPVLINGESPRFCLQSGRHQYIFSYGFNPAYYLQFAVYPGFYLFVFAFILLIRRIQRVQLQQKFKAEKRMAELQLLSLRNQMDPHFTFNVLNTIGAAILQNKNEESYNLLLKFSKMIRTTVSSSDQICRSLQEELDFVKNYLDLQLIRCNGCFKFTIDVDKHIDPLQPLPKMILQTYVENALKHGLIPKKSGGLLKISAIKENGRISLTIEDNGVGRQQAQINGTLSTGVGLKIMRQYYELLNRNNQFHITEEFSDLYDENGQAAGTRVVIRIPEGYEYTGSS